MQCNLSLNSVGPNGLVPTLRDFGALPRLGIFSDLQYPFTAKIVIAFPKTTNEVSKLFASRQVCDTLQFRNGPRVTGVHTTPIGAPVLVSGPEKDQWDGP